MLYHAYELQRSFLSSASAIATIGANMLNSPLNPMTFFGGEPIMASALEVFAHASAPYGKPAFGITTVDIDGAPSAVNEEIVLKRPFGDLIRFRHEKLAKDAPRLLIVAPMSGHYATLHGLYLCSCLVFCLWPPFLLFLLAASSCFRKKGSIC